MNAFIKFINKTNPRANSHPIFISNATPVERGCPYALCMAMNQKYPKFYHYVQVIKRRHED